MPRTTAKSKSGKKKRTPPVPVTPAPTGELETNPCDSTDSQLNDIMMEEERDEIVKGTMDELLSKVMNGCLKVYVERQVKMWSTFVLFRFYFSV